MLCDTVTITSPNQCFFYSIADHALPAAPAPLVDHAHPAGKLKVTLVELYSLTVPEFYRYLS